MIETPFISVVIPVRNEADSLLSLLHSIAAQDYPADRFEVIISDGLSTDKTAEIVLEYARTSRVAFRLVTNHRVRSGAGRNAGIRAAKGEIVLFIDGHCVVPSSYLLRDTARLISVTGAHCLCRPQPLIAPSRSLFGRVVADARASWLGHGRDSLIYDLTYSGVADPTTSGAAYRREVFDSIGYYDESFDACEDCDFNLRVRKAGFSAYSDPSLAIYYEPRANVKGLWKQMVRYGRGRVRLMRKHPDYVSASQLAPAAILISPFACLLLLRLPMFIQMIAALPLFCFVMATFAVTVTLARRNGLHYILQAPVAFGCIYFGMGAGMLLEFIMPAGLKKYGLSRLHVR